MTNVNNLRSLLQWRESLEFVLYSLSGFILILTKSVSEGEQNAMFIFLPSFFYKMFNL